MLSAKGELWKGRRGKGERRGGEERGKGVRKGIEELGKVKEREKQKYETLT